MKRFSSKLTFTLYVLYILQNESGQPVYYVFSLRTQSHLEAKRYAQKSLGFFLVFCFVVVVFFSRECNIEGGGGEGVKEMWYVILLGCTNLCSVGQISNRYKCSSTRTERKMKIT